MLSSLHEDLINEYVFRYPYIQITGFKRLLKKIYKSRTGYKDIPEIDCEYRETDNCDPDTCCLSLRNDCLNDRSGYDILKKIRLKPDAYHYCSFCSSLRVIEVVVSNNIDKKIGDYLDLFWWLDEIYISLAVTEIDRYNVARDKKIFNLAYKELGAILSDDIIAYTCY
jgi:hypothetical protein